MTTEKVILEIAKEFVDIHYKGQLEFRMIPVLGDLCTLFVAEHGYGIVFELMSIDEIKFRQKNGTLRVSRRFEENAAFKSQAGK